MNKSDPYLMNRRGILKGSAAALGGALLSGEPLEAYPQGINTNSSPSALRLAGADGSILWLVEETNHMTYAIQTVNQ